VPSRRPSGLGRASAAATSLFQSGTEELPWCHPDSPPPCGGKPHLWYGRRHGRADTVPYANGGRPAAPTHPANWASDRDSRGHSTTPSAPASQQVAGSLCPSVSCTRPVHRLLGDGSTWHPMASNGGDQKRSRHRPRPLSAFAEGPPGERERVVQRVAVAAERPRFGDRPGHRIPAQETAGTRVVVPRPQVDQRIAIGLLPRCSRRAAPCHPRCS
jgi:hypothetical protein